ncbi:MAG: DUF2490 domain-containing protein [Hyphomonas sp.]|uniref:DUF2490 domain-containing protein n=1 Tax=Hyphomonas sp. TaxID=87 RepID=UPI0034A08A8D
MNRPVLLACAALALAAPVASAENQVWTQIDLAAKPAEGSKFEFGMNAELRYQPDGELDAVELRPGLTYELRGGLSVSGGYLYAVNRRAGPDRKEHRLWQMVGYDLFKVGEGKFSGRSRVEERWREETSGTGWRLRQQFAYAHPIGETGLTLSLSDEATIGLNTTDWGSASGLQENRARATAKWKAAGAGWELGYLNQFRNGVNGAADETNHHIFAGVSKDF